MRILITGLCLALVACSSTAPRPAHDPLAPVTAPPERTAHRDTVRVGLLVDVAAATIAVSEDVQLLTPTGRVATTLPGGHFRLIPHANGLAVVRTGETLWLDAQLDTVRLRGSGLWSVGDNQYAGELEVLRTDVGVTLVNVVDIEDYLRGVVPWEIGRPEEAALEAVKAQAIAARTYTYSHLNHWSDLGFDVYDTVTDQVYRGRTGTHAITDRAVRDTAGRVVTHRGQLIRAYYSSTCGGFGSTLSDVWTKAPAEYLRGGRDAAEGQASWCADSPQFRWSESWSARQLGDIVREHLPAELGISSDEVGALRNLEVRERDRSGRVRRLIIHTDRGEYEVVGDRIRWVLRPAASRFGILRSTLFTVEPVRRDGRLVAVRLSGGGFGHGVGMCQTGALGMARAGYRADDILRHYYPGVRVEPVGAGRMAR